MDAITFVCVYAHRGLLREDRGDFEIACQPNIIQILMAYYNECCYLRVVLF